MSDKVCALMIMMFCMLVSALEMSHNPHTGKNMFDNHLIELIVCELCLSAFEEHKVHGVKDISRKLEKSRRRLSNARPGHMENFHEHGKETTLCTKAAVAAVNFKSIL